MLLVPMLRRTILPLGLIAVAFAAFAWSAASFADGRDLAGIYLLAVALVAARAEQRVATSAPP